MTLTNVEKELIATQIHDLDKSFERVVIDQRKDWTSKTMADSKTYLEHLQATRAVIKDLKKYWVERQQ